MPNITLENNKIDISRIMSIMCVPTDDVLREQFFINKIQQEIIVNSNPTDTFVIDKKTLKIILDSPSFSQFEAIVESSTKMGVIAGDLLASIYMMDRFKIPEPSMNKAIHVAQKYAERTTYGDKSRMFASKTKIREYWELFKPVAHFWAAMRLNYDYPFYQGDNIFEEESFPIFLEVAAGLQNFFINFIPPRSNVPLIDKNDVWLLPDSISPRKLESDIKPDILFDAISTYRAPISL